MSTPAPHSGTVAPDRAVPMLTTRIRRLHADAARTRRQTASPGAAGRVQGVLVAIDGPTGAGKSVLARCLIQSLARFRLDTSLIELEELVPGWSGLARGVHSGGALLTDLDRGRDARAPRWDWRDMEPRDPLRIEPLDGGVLVLEGCGALAAAARPLPHLSVLRVWVTAGTEARHARIAARDPYRWDVAAWEAQEHEVARAWRTHAEAGPDVIVDSSAPHRL